jgi:DNA invertase Pin-like site-specific DNA recombinase
VAGIHAYIRAAYSEPAHSADTQREAIRSYCRTHTLVPELPSPAGPPVPAEPYWYVDQATSGKILLREREAGGVLCRNLRPGDHVVITKLDRAFRGLSDCLAMLEDFKARSIRLHVCNMLGGAIDLSSPIGCILMHILGAFVELERAVAAERASATSRDRRNQGLGLGPPRIGFKYVPRVRTLANGRKRRYLAQVEDPTERETMKLILRRRREGRSWDEIRRELAYELKIKARGGAEWSVSRLRRAARSEAILQLLESRGCRPADVHAVLGRLADWAAAPVEHDQAGGPV